MDVAGSVVFPASPGASLINGHTMPIDGVGRHVERAASVTYA